MNKEKISKGWLSKKVNRDWWLSSLILILLGLGVVLNLRYRMISVILRLGIGLLWFGILTYFFSLMNSGKEFFQFVKEAKVELFKVVWPTKEEALRVGVLIGVLVFVASLILWLMDSCLIGLLGWITKV